MTTVRDIAAQYAEARQAVNQKKEELAQLVTARDALQAKLQESMEPGDRLSIGDLTVSVVQPKPRVDVVDLDAYVAWCDEHAPHLVRRKVEPDKIGLKSFTNVEDGFIVNKDGEVIPGLDQVTPPPYLSVRSKA